MRATPDDGDRARAGLALRQVRGGGELIAHGDLRDEQLVPGGVDHPRVPGEHGDPGGADRRVGLAGAPRAPHGVGDEHADPAPGELCERGGERSSGAVGVLGQKRDLVRGHVRTVHARRRLHDPERVLGDKRPLNLRDDAHRLLIDQSAAQHISGLRIGGGGNKPPLDLREHLRGEYDDVTVGEALRRVPKYARESAREVVARPEIRQAVGRPDLDRTSGGVLAHGAQPTDSRAVATMAEVSSGVVISSGASRTSTPSTAA